MHLSSPLWKVNYSISTALETSKKFLAVPAKIDARYCRLQMMLLFTRGVYAVAQLSVVLQV